MVLIFDTESSGKVDFKAPLLAPHQPRLVELAFGLYSPDAKLIQHASVIVRPEGFTIPDEAAAIHGITTKTALEIGLPLLTVLSLFNWAMKIATVHVAFNNAFDERILRREFEGVKKESPFLPAKRYDTMMAAKDYCKLPNQYGYDDYKWPSLAEAHQHFFGCAFDGAHEAMGDVAATAKVYFEIQRLEQKQPAVPSVRGLPVAERKP